MNLKFLKSGFVLAIVLAAGAVVYFSSGFSRNAPVAQSACGEHGKNADDAHNENAGGHEHEKVIKLKETTIKEFGIEISEAQGGKIGTYTTLPAEIAVNGDKMAHIVPRIPGVVRFVAKNLGDKVRAGDVLAVIHSRELADFRAGYLAALEKVTLSQALFEREKSLWEKKITAEQEYLSAKRDLADARIELRSAEQKLHALGFPEEYLKGLQNHPEESFIVYEITSPIGGTIIEKHITLGEVLKEDSEPFVVADLSNVWVNVNIHQKELMNIKLNQKALVKTEHMRGEGLLSYVGSIVDENTRTALARIVLPNAEGLWRPGTFATASVYMEEADCDVVVPKDAIVTLEGKTFVFIFEEEGFEAKAVQVGRVNGEYAEIASGLEAGQKYVSKGAFTLKSELTKSTGDPCGGH